MPKAKPKTKLEIVLPISPINLACPLCHAKPKKSCSTPSGIKLEVVHIARIKAAAKANAA